MPDDDLFKGLNDITPAKTNRESKNHVYFFALIIGIVAAVLLIGGLKVLRLFLKFGYLFLKDYWVWVVAGLIVMLLLKKLLSRKRVEVHREMGPSY